MDNRASRNDECALREKAREAIRRGRLPKGKPDRTYGGPGSGMACVVCGVVVTRDDVELEIEFGRHGAMPGSDCYHVHPRCFIAWEFEGRSIDAGNPVTSVTTLPS